MLPPLSVPSSQRKPLEGLVRLSDPDFAVLLAIGVEVAPATSPLELWERLVGSARATADQAAMLLVGTNLRRVIDEHRVGSDEVATAVVQDSREKRWFTEDTDLERLKNRLNQLLELPSIVLTSKAFDLCNQHDSAFSSARVLTDVRPLFFGDSTKLQTTVAVIQHTLKIEIRYGDDMYSSMTSKELRELQAAVTRAIRKEEILRGQLRLSGFTFIDDDLLKNTDQAT